MLKTLTDCQEKLAHDINAQLVNIIQTNLQQAFHMFGVGDEEQENTPPVQGANDISSDNIYTILKELQDQVKKLGEENKALKSTRNQPSTPQNTPLSDSTINPKSWLPVKILLLVIRMLYLLG